MFLIIGSKIVIFLLICLLAWYILKTLFPGLAIKDKLGIMNENSRIASEIPEKAKKVKKRDKINQQKIKSFLKEK